MRDIITATLAMLCLAATTGHLLSAAEQPPNIVIIFTDDQGYGDLSIHGHPTIRTPRLDQMATEGLRMTGFTVASPICTPSRAALLTGRLPVRSGMTGVLAPNSIGGLPTQEITLAEHLREHGYATAMIGKWHLGHLREHLPIEHGFDGWLGLPYSNDMLWGKRGDPPLPLMRDAQIIEAHQASRRLQETLTERYTVEAERIIAERDPDRPLFLYLAHTFPHVPLYVDQAWAGRSRGGAYGDVIEHIDHSTGRILDALAAAGIDNETLVIFTSDNGPWITKGAQAGSAGPFRGGKMTTWEGGMRVPALVRWPGRIPAGSTSADLVNAMDLYPTICALAGLPLPSTQLDGIDVSEHLTTGSPSPRTTMAYYDRERLVAWRSGPWKLHLETRGPGSRDPWEVLDAPLLYNLDHDPGERSDRARRQPDVVARLLAEMAAHQAAVVPADIIQTDLPPLDPEATRASLDYALPTP